MWPGQQRMCPRRVEVNGAVVNANDVLVRVRGAWARQPIPKCMSTFVCITTTYDERRKPMALQQNPNVHEGLHHTKTKITNKTQNTHQHHQSTAQTDPPNASRHSPPSYGTQTASHPDSQSSHANSAHGRRTPFLCGGLEAR